MLWQYSDDRKVPRNPSWGYLDQAVGYAFVGAKDPNAWFDFETASNWVDHDDDLGFAYYHTGPDHDDWDDDEKYAWVDPEEDVPSEPHVGLLDFDDIRDPETGDVDDTARDIIERLDSYTEISPSGTGYHVLITGDLPGGRNRRGSVELYDTARFFTVTGDHVDVTPGRVAHRQDALEAIHREYIQEPESDTTSEIDRRGPVAEDASEPTGDIDLDDEELLRKARTASNGAKFDRLWNGSISGYDSHSEADMALCCLLAFWTGGARSRIDQLFQQSGLMREKWDEVHYADGSTYGEKTIEHALQTTSEFYEPQSQAASEPTDTAADRATASGDPERSRAYLIEKNQLLRERVATLEATLETKTERIDALETELEEMEATQATRTDQDLSTSESTDARSADDGTQSEGSSLWKRIKRVLGVNVE
ncbi:hypothetical protein [Natrinema gelatinilyticum]|uniref:phage NrS-1 polymerase family protein n=1 Tax=Natrinema gelatinilyticum TaxID=2961571 RepID=UPI003CE52E77